MVPTVPIARRLKIGLLDLGLLYGTSSKQALSDTLERAVVADRLGYSRYWLTEHQSPWDAWGNPTPLIAAIAAKTRQIKIGCAGILLAYYNPLAVANDFTLLSTMFPNRIDLGLARQRPILPGNARELLRGTEDVFSTNLEALLGYFGGDGMPEDAALLPQGGDRPEIWALGTTRASAESAASNGLSYAHSLFHASSNEPNDALSHYRTHYERDAWTRRTLEYSSEWTLLKNSGTVNPVAAIAVAGVCATTPQKVDEIASAHQNERLVPRVQGDASTCYSKFREIASAFSVDEIIFLDLAQSHDDRLATIRELSRIAALEETKE